MTKRVTWDGLHGAAALLAYGHFTGILPSYYAMGLDRPDILFIQHVQEHVLFYL